MNEGEKTIMSTTNNGYWKDFQRQHRIVANYLALQAWLRDLDCIVLKRSDLKSFFGMESTTKKHIKRFTSDIKAWFRYSQPYYREDSDTYIRFLFLSRVEFTLPARYGSMNLHQLIEAIKEKLPRVAQFSGPDFHNLLSQDEIISDSALLTAGLKEPQLRITRKPDGSKSVKAESTLESFKQQAATRVVKTVVSSPIVFEKI